MLDTERKTHQTVCDAHLLAFDLGDRGVGHRRRMTNQRFDSAQALRQTKQLHTRDETDRLLYRKLKRYGYNALTPTHLPLGQLDLGMGIQPRLANELHLGSILEKTSKRQIIGRTETRC